jgi:hypothetical protein
MSAQPAANPHGSNHGPGTRSQSSSPSTMPAPTEGSATRRSRRSILVPGCYHAPTMNSTSNPRSVASGIPLACATLPSAHDPFATAGPLRNPLHSLRSDEPDSFEAPRSLTSAAPGIMHRSGLPGDPPEEHSGQEGTRRPVARARSGTRASSADSACMLRGVLLPLQASTQTLDPPSHGRGRICPRPHRAPAFASATF